MLVGHQGTNDALKQPVFLKEKERDEHYCKQTDEGTGDHGSHRTHNAAYLSEINQLPDFLHD